MAGRRLRKAITDLATSLGVKDPVATIAGLSNSYTHYVATYEEYAGQRYEAASTLYGPHTLSAYIQEFRRITRDMIKGGSSSTAGPPPDLSDKQISLIPPVVYDPIEIGKRYGSVVDGPKDKYTAGEETVHVVFRSANPRNNQRIEGTYLIVERQSGGDWKKVYVDGHWCTKVSWKADPFWGFVFAETSWEIPAETFVGAYRICHFGTAKQLVKSEHQVEAPAWMTKILGAAFASGIASAVDFIASLPDKLRETSSASEYMMEFGGCTTSFQVRVKNNAG